MTIDRIMSDSQICLYGDGKNIFQIVIHKDLSDTEATFVYKIKQ